MFLGKFPAGFESVLLDSNIGSEKDRISCFHTELRFGRFVLINSGKIFSAMMRGFRQSFTDYGFSNSMFVYGVSHDFVNRIEQR